jgi:hypothetical protein
MRHTREEVIERIEREFTVLDNLVASLSEEDWARPLRRKGTQDPWTVKDALAHITHWKADTARSARKQRRPPEERGLDENAANHIIFERWHSRPAQEVLEWHRQVQADLLQAMRDAPEVYFTGKERNPQWPFDVDGHSTEHRVKDIERLLSGSKDR